MTNEELVAEIKQGMHVNENMQVLYQQNLGIIRKVIKPYAHYSEYDDLMQESYFGLCRAVDKYNPDEEVPFINYAIRCIKVTASRYVMNTGRTKRIPVYMVSLISKYKKFIADYQKQCQETPKDTEICRGLGITQRRLNSLLKIEHEMNCSSIDVVINGTDDITIGESIVSDIDIETEVTEYYTRQADVKLLWEIVSDLEERQSETLIDRYQYNKTLKECADLLGISKERVRQIEKKAFEILRKNKRIREIAQDYGYGYNTSSVYKWGVGRFKNTWTSSTENTAIKQAERWEKLRLMHEEMQELLNMKS